MSHRAAGSAQLQIHFQAAAGGLGVLLPEGRGLVGTWGSKAGIWALQGWLEDAERGGHWQQSW